MNKFNSILLFAILLVFTSCKSKQKNVRRQDHATYKENLIKANRGMVENDQNKIAKYVERNSWQMNVSETGLWYEIIKGNSGEQVEVSKVAHLRYEVSLLDGTHCYSSDSIGILSFKVGQGGVESGLEEGILKMEVGDKGRFILPPHLAHGLMGDENKIPPRSTIVYFVELLNLTE